MDDYIAENNAVHVIDVFLGDLDLSGLGFKTEPNDTGRPAYHPSTMLKLFVYGYLNRVHSSRRLKLEAQRNVELMRLTGRLAPDFKTIAGFRKDNANKDLGYFLEMVKDLGTESQTAEGTSANLKAAVDAGLGNGNVSEIMDYFLKLEKG